MDPFEFIEEKYKIPENQWENIFQINNGKLKVLLRAFFDPLKFSLGKNSSLTLTQESEKTIAILGYNNSSGTTVYSEGKSSLFSLLALVEKINYKECKYRLTKSKLEAISKIF